MSQSSRTCRIFRHFFAALLFVAAAANLRAQAEDFLFMEIAMDTDIGTYQRQLMERGFTRQERTAAELADHPDNYVFTGRTTSGKNVTVDVSTTTKSKTVYALSVTFNDYTFYQWKKGGVSDEAQRAAFEAIKEELIEYYGTPTGHFDYLLSTDDSTREAHAHDSFPVMYGWNHNKGTVLFTFANLTAEKRDLMLFYTDSAAKAKKNKEKIEDL